MRHPKTAMSSALVLLGAVLCSADASAQARSPKTNVSGRGPADGSVTRYGFGAQWEADNHVTQGSRAGDTVYVAGQFSHDLKGDFIGEGDVAKQTRATFENIDRVLGKLGASKERIMELEVFLLDSRKNHDAFTQEYRHYVGAGALTVTLIGVTALYYPQELVEIRAVAHARAR